MKNHKGNSTVLMRSLLFFNLFIISGCLPFIPDQSFKSTNDMAIVFGYVERLTDGKSVPHSTHKRSWSRLCVDPIDEDYIWRKLRFLPPGSKKTDSCKYWIRIPGPHGYFTTALPPGKYVINAINIPEGNWNWIPDRTPHIATFDVIPQKATYIGTIQVIEIMAVKNYSVYKKKSTVFDEFLAGPAFGVTGLIASLPPTETISKDEYMKLSPSAQRMYDEIIKQSGSNFLGSWQITNEFEEAKKIFTSLYPDHSELIERIGEIKSDDAKKTDE
jgi:hypothetical protein